jgi:hypothetical protein
MTAAMSQRIAKKNVPKKSGAPILYVGKTHSLVSLPDAKI